MEEVERNETELSDKKKRKREKGSPMLITLKPFYRPNEKKGVKKRKLDAAYDDAEEYVEEEFTPRSPVPLPDNVNLRPVLKPYMTRCQDKKNVSYADGVLPGQGSPDHHLTPGVTTPAPAGVSQGTPVQSKTGGRKKRYKKIKITVITQHSGDTDSDEDVPPPPPGSPPR